MLKRLLSSVLFLSGFLAYSGFVVAQDPLITLRSSGTSRLLQVIERLGLPDPIASSGLDTESTLELLQEGVDLEATSGGLLYFADGRPQMVICLPLIKLEGFLEALPKFGGTQFEKEASGVYRLGNPAKMYAMQSKKYLLLSDSPDFLPKAMGALESKPWTPVKDDIQLIADLRRFPSISRFAIANEIASLVSTPPSIELLLNRDSLREHLRYRFPRFLIHSLFESRSFELTLNETSEGDMEIRVLTSEEAVDARIPSEFTPINGSKATFAFDFSSKLNEQTTAAVREWASNFSREINQALTSDRVEDQSSNDIIRSGLRNFENIVKLAVDHKRLDACFAVGNDEGTPFGMMGLTVQDGPKFASELKQLLNTARSLGMNWDSLQSPKSDPKEHLNVSLTLPGGMLPFGDGETQVHLVVYANRLSLTTGQEGESIRRNSMKQDSLATTQPISLEVDLDRGTELGEGSQTSTLLPLQYRQLRLQVSLTDSGRRYDLLLAKKSNEAPAKRELTQSNP